MTKLNYLHIASVVGYVAAAAVGVPALNRYIAKKDEAIKNKQINELKA